jgi:hypothetical protein
MIGSIGDFLKTAKGRIITAVGSSIGAAVLYFGPNILVATGGDKALRTGMQWYCSIEHSNRMQVRSLFNTNGGGAMLFAFCPSDSPEDFKAQIDAALEAYRGMVNEKSLIRPVEDDNTGGVIRDWSD